MFNGVPCVVMAVGSFVQFFYEGKEEQRSGNVEKLTDAYIIMRDAARGGHHRCFQINKMTQLRIWNQ
jgi:hypothetical protein